MIKHTTCDNCDNEKFKLLYLGHDRMYKIEGKYPVYKCLNCGLIFLNPRPSKSELLKHYPQESYYSLESLELPKLEHFLYKVYYSEKSSVLKRLFFLPLKPIIRTVKTVPGGKVLDVGCGSGAFLLLLRNFGMECHGVETGRLNKDFVKKHELDIKNCSIIEANFPNNYFDVITMNHVLEHVENPTKTIKELYRILKPGGTLIIATPQSHSLAYKIFKEYWVQLDVPRHLFTFSTKILKQYVKKAGFKVKKMRYNSLPFQFTASLMYFINNYRKKPIYLSEKKFYNNKVLFFIFLPLCHMFNFFNFGDQVELILTK